MIRSDWHINIKNHHHHHVVRQARISQTLFLHVSLSFITPGRSSGLHPVSSHSCCMKFKVGRPAFDWPYAGVHWSTSLTSLSLLLQQCPACLVRLAWIVFVIGGRDRIVGTLWGVAARTCSILLATFLYNCRLIVGVNRSTSLMSSSLLLQQCPACLVRLAWILVSLFNGTSTFVGYFNAKSILLEEQ